MSKKQTSVAINNEKTATAQELRAIIEPPGNFCERFQKLSKLSKSLSLDESKPERTFNIMTLAVEPGEFEWINQVLNNSLAALALDKPKIKNFIKWFCFWNFEYEIMAYLGRKRFQEQITKDLIKQTQNGRPLAIGLNAFEHYIVIPGVAAPVTDEQVFQRLVQMEKEAV